MPTLTVPAPPSAPTVGLRLAPDSRPPAYRWVDELPATTASVATGPTLFDPPPPDPSAASATPPTPSAAHLARLVKLPGGIVPRTDLPEPLTWCRTLAPALVEVLQRRRPITQLARWLDDPVLGSLTVSLRLRERSGAAPPERGVVHSLRVQCPSPVSVEASVHVRLPSRSAALAFRLVAGPGGRWLCTAVDLGDATLLGVLDRRRPR
ncbi:MAG: Rv3235 family protein [Propionibacteriaceae bacterium]